MAISDNIYLICDCGQFESIYIGDAILDKFPWDGWERSQIKATCLQCKDKQEGYTGGYCFRCDTRLFRDDDGYRPENELCVMCESITRIRYEL
jgi:hypothetical protein